MGRSCSSKNAYSDIAYAVCNFGNNISISYKLLNADFAPAQYIPDFTLVQAPIAVSQYASYGSVTPSGYGLSRDPVFSLGGAWSGPANTSGNNIYYDGRLQRALSLSGCQDQPSSSNNQSSNYTGRTGEYGHDHWNMDRNGRMYVPLMASSYVQETKTELNDAFVNADLSDPTLTLLYWQNNLYLARRTEIEQIIVSNGLSGYISKFAIASSNANFYGNASYNAARKELVIIGATNISYSTMWIRIYPNVEINSSTDLNTVLTAITPTQITIPWAGYTPLNDTEAVGGCVPVLTDNGDVFFIFFNAATAMYATRWPRNTATTFKTMVSALGYTVTTSYGRNSSRSSGMQSLQTRDGNTVACYAQYYYYGAGMGVFTVNKRTNSIKLMYSDTESANGRSLLHWRNNGFIVVANAFASYGAVAGPLSAYDCSVQTSTVSPKAVLISTPDGYNTGAPYPFFVEVTK